MNLSEGKYWDEYLTPVTREKSETEKGLFKACPRQLSRVLNNNAPTVYLSRCDLFNPEITDDFRDEVYGTIANCDRHTFLIHTDSHENALRYCGSQYRWAMIEGNAQRIFDKRTGEYSGDWFAVHELQNVYHMLTIHNQPEADKKIPVFLQIPGNLCLSLELSLSKINLEPFFRCPLCGYSRQDQFIHGDHRLCKGGKIPEIRCIILEGETGSVAHPMHLDWVRSVRDQCAAAGVSFFFKGWGEWLPVGPFDLHPGCKYDDEKQWLDEDCAAFRVGKKLAGRLLDGRTHDDLPWVGRVS